MYMHMRSGLRTRLNYLPGCCRRRKADCECQEPATRLMYTSLFLSDPKDKTSLGFLLLITAKGLCSVRYMDTFSPVLFCFQVSRFPMQTNFLRRYLEFANRPDPWV
jgi:hypothetical protein